MAKKKGVDLVCTNAKAHQRFEIEDRIEAGIVLTGSEVKSLRARRADLDGAYADVAGDAVYLHKAHIGAWEHAGPFAHELRRSRKLLLRAHEVERLHGQLSTRGYTLIPTKLYFKDGWAKVELALARSKNVRDRREDIKREIAKDEARDAMSKGTRARRAGTR